MMSLADQKKRLEQVKRELNLDVYYKVDTTTYNGQPVLINEVNEYAWDKNGKRYNRHTGFKSVLMTQKDNDDLFELRLMWKKDMRAIILVKDIELRDCHEWMKQFFSAARWIAKEMAGREPKSIEDIKMTESYGIQFQRLRDFHNEIKKRNNDEIE